MRQALADASLFDEGQIYDRKHPAQRICFAALGGELAEPALPTSVGFFFIFLPSPSPLARFFLQGPNKELTIPLKIIRKSS